MSTWHEIIDGLEGPKLQIDIIGQSLTTLKSMLYHSDHCHAPINISAYFPQSIVEQDIQLFNLTNGGHLPAHLHNNDDIAMWLLETDTLDREIVANFLTNTSNPDSSKILDLLALKIASLEASSAGLIEGLRLFLPVVGGVHRSSSTQSTAVTIPFLADKSKLATMLTAYAKMHVQLSTNPVINTAAFNNQQQNIVNNGQSNIPVKPYLVVSALLLEIIEVYTALAIAERPLSVIMMDFFQAVKQMMDRFDPPPPSQTTVLEHDSLQQRYSMVTSLTPPGQQQRPPMILPKTLSDLFNTITSGSAIAPLPVPESKVPSFLFANVLLSGWVQLEFQETEHSDDIQTQQYLAKLTHNALYLLVDNDSALIVQACLPLEFLNPKLADNRTSQPHIDLFPAIGDSIPCILSHPATATATVHTEIANRSNTDTVAVGPSHVGYYHKLTLEILMDDAGAEHRRVTAMTAEDSPLPADHATIRNQFKKQFQATMNLLDKLETVTWKCRNK